MLSPRSRGKGSRRVPGRDGGRRKRKPVEWRKQATHAVDDVSQLDGVLIELTHVCPFGRSAAECIYLFDQEVARAGIRYHAELRGTRLTPMFALRVPAAHEGTVRAIIDRVRKK